MHSILRVSKKSKGKESEFLLAAEGKVGVL